MKRKVILHGHLRERFGESYELDCRSAGEALRALTTQVVGFEDAFSEGDYGLARKTPRGEWRTIGLGNLGMGLGKSPEVHVIPSQQAAGVELLFYAGIALLASAVTVALLGSPIKPDDPQDRERDASRLFDGPINVVEQGHPLAIVYGRMRVGSIVISGGISYERMSEGNMYSNANGGTGGVATSGFELGLDKDYYVEAPSTGRLITDLIVGAQTQTQSSGKLQARATARIIDAIGEGKIGGLVNGLKSVYIDGTPVENSDGSRNFDGFEYEERLGEPDQTYMAGFPTQESTTTMNLQVETGTPQVFTITNPNANRARVTPRIAALYTQDDEGDMKPFKVQFAIDVKTSAGSFVEVINHTITGQTTSPYPEDFNVNLPPGGAPWQIRMRRITADNEDTRKANDTFLYSVTEIIDAKFQYPNTALMGVTIDAEKYGARFQNRAYEIDGLEIEYPANYNPVTRTYATSGPGTSGGVWDGTFTTGVCNNPAWVFRDLCVKRRYGAGKQIGAARLDKYQLYAIAQYCDGEVDDGRGGTEPRYVCNLVINQRMPARQVLTGLADMFSALVYWSAGGIFVAQDRPISGEPKRLLVPANARNGKIVYDSSEAKTQKSAVVVTFIDPDDGYRQGFEIVQDDALVQSMGFQPISVVAYGCTSRGQARRYGRLWLDNQRYGAEFANYQTGADFGVAEPGEVFKINDPRFTGERRGGRVRSATTTAVTIDKPVTITNGQVYTLSVMLPTGVVQSRTLTNTAATNVSVLTCSAFSIAPNPDAIWSLETNAVATRKFRLHSIGNDAHGEYTLRARLYDPNKYARVEQGLVIDPAPYIDNLPGGYLIPPSTVDVFEFMKQDGNSTIPCAHVSWPMPRDYRIRAFIAQVMRPDSDEWETMEGTALLWRDLINVTAGTYKFRVRSTDGGERTGPWSTVVEQALNGPAGAAGMPGITGLVLNRNEDGGLIELNWNRPIDERPFYYEVFRNVSSDSFVGATRIGTTQDERYSIGLAGWYYVRTRFMNAVGTPATLRVLAGDLLQLRADIDINADAIAEEILRGAAHRAYTDLQLFVEGQAIGTFVSQGFEEINEGMSQYASWFTLLGAQNVGGTAWILNASSVIVDDGSTATSLVSLVSTWNGMTASIDELAEVIDGQVGRYALNIDVGGYLIGWEAVNGGTPETGSIIFKTSNFFIADPDNGIGGAGVSPFSVVGGLVYANELWVRRIIANSIVTDMLVDNSISERMVARDDSDVTLSSSAGFSLAQSTNFDSINSILKIDCVVGVSRSSADGSRGDITIELRRGSTVIESRRSSALYANSSNEVCDWNHTFIIDSVPAGTNTWNIYVRIGNGGGGWSGWTKRNCVMSFTEFKK